MPTYNERDNLPTLVEQLMQHANVRVLVVDDQSPDGTGAVADGLARAMPGRVDVLHRTGRRGFGLSYIDGLSRAMKEPVDLICQMDADLSHDARQLPDLMAAAADADVVIGSRYVPGGAIVNWPLRRRLLSRFANIYIRSVTRLSARDCTSGYRCWRREALAKLPLDQFVSDGYSFLIEMLFMAAGLASGSSRSRSRSSNAAWASRKCREPCSSNRADAVAARRARPVALSPFRAMV